MKVASDSRSIIVLGMHRSGTSALAGTLRAHGVYFGEVLDQGIQHNPKGLQEAPSILYMHEDLLVKNGGAWHSPPLKIEWQPMHKAVRDLFIESRANKSCWAFKDPRTLLVLEGWIEALPKLEAVGIFRHPAEVAMSIHTRNGFELTKCLQIWGAYNQRLLSLQREHGFPIIEFVGDGDAMQRSLSKATHALNLSGETQNEPFFEAGLKRQNQPDIAIPDDVLSLYQALQAQAL